MTIGTGTFVPTGRYFFPRPYACDFIFYRNFGVLHQSGGSFLLNAPSPDPTFFVVELQPNLWDWTTAAYSLDHVVEQSWYKPGGVGPELPMYFTLSFIINTTTGRRELHYAPFGLTFDPVLFTLPPSPTGYWLNPICS